MKNTFKALLFVTILSLGFFSLNVSAHDGISDPVEEVTTTGAITPPTTTTSTTEQNTQPDVTMIIIIVVIAIIIVSLLAIGFTSMSDKSTSTTEVNRTTTTSV